MNKIFLNVALMSVLLTACGSAETKEKEEVKTDETQSAEVTEEKGKVVKEEPKTPTLNLNETVIIEDFAEITVTANNFGKTINPPNPGSFYTYYENKEADQIYLDTVISIKSLLTSQKSADEMASVKIIYDNKYEYVSFSVIEDQGGADFTYTNITGIEPLQTGTLHYLASLPLSAETDGKPLKAVISINGDTYEQIIR